MDSNDLQKSRGSDHNNEQKEKAETSPVRHSQDAGLWELLDYRHIWLNLKSHMVIL
jgi:hypothetical protein